MVLWLSGARVVSRALEGKLEPRSMTNVWLERSPRWQSMCVNSIGVACADVERLCIMDVAVK